MLVLARSVGDEVVIGDNIRLVVISIRGTHVRLGFEAPREVGIVRREVAARLEPAFELDPAMGPSVGEIELESDAKW